MAIKLRMVNSKQAGAMLPVLKTPYVIGRHKDCDLKVGSPQVSVHHCAILLRDGRAWIRDLDSTNGTRVNGEPIHQDRELKTKDVLWVGPALIEVVFDASVDILGAADAGEYTATLPHFVAPTLADRPPPTIRVQHPIEPEE